MPLTIPQWLRKQGAWLFGARTSAYLPGTMFAKRRVAFGPARFEYRTNVWIELGLPKSDFAPVQVVADMVQGTIRDAFDADTALGLRMFGVDIGAGASLVQQVEMSIDEITGLTLDDEAWSPWKLARLINKLDSPELSRLYVAHTLYYASRCTVTVSTDGSHDAKVTLNRGLVDAGLLVTRTTEKQLTFATTSTVPFAFSGMRSRQAP